MPVLLSFPPARHLQHLTRPDACISLCVPMREFRCLNTVKTDSFSSLQDYACTLLNAELHSKKVNINTYILELVQLSNRVQNETQHVQGHPTTVFCKYLFSEANIPRIVYDLRTAKNQKITVQPLQISNNVSLQLNNFRSLSNKSPTIF